MEFSQEIELAGRRTDESRALFNIYINFFVIINFLPKIQGVQKGGPERGIHVLSTPIFIAVSTD